MCLLLDEPGAFIGVFGFIFKPRPAGLNEADGKGGGLPDARLLRSDGKALWTFQRPWSAFPDLLEHDPVPSRILRGGRSQLCFPPGSTQLLLNTRNFLSNAITIHFVAHDIIRSFQIPNKCLQAAD